MELEIYKTLVLSTAHLLPETLEWLEQDHLYEAMALGYPDTFFTDTEYGGRLNIGEWMQSSLPDARRWHTHLPADLWDTIALAHQNGCARIEFDQDGNILPAELLANYEEQW